MWGTIGKSVATVAGMVTAGVLAAEIAEDGYDSAKSGVKRVYRWATSSKSSNSSSSRKRSKKSKAKSSAKRNRTAVRPARKRAA